jgi:C1A family cysteine protease
MATKKPRPGSDKSGASSKRPAIGDNLQSTIYTKGYNWTAAATSVSDISDADFTARLGLSPTQAELQATEAAITASEQFHATFAAGIGAPPSVDWRNKSGNWTTPVKDQLSCGSCVSFATCGTLESRINIACNNPNLDVDLSEAQLFYCGCSNCCVPGWNFPPALEFCKNTGVTKEVNFPYTAGNQPCRAGLTPFVKITNWTAVLAVADRKNVLSTKGPMVAGMAVYEDFRSYGGGVYRHTTGVFKGYHAISVVGYDDSQQCWICKNSWGTGWGESGFFRIGYGDSQIDTTFAFYDMDVKCPTDTGPGPVVDDCQRYLPALQRVLTSARLNPSLRLCLRYYVCGKTPRPNCSAAYIAVAQAVVAILRICPKYREPFCRALG